MSMYNFILGLITGWITLYLFVLIFKSFKRRKKGIKYKDYKNLPFTSRLKDVLRRIVYEYKVKRNNNDFLLDITLDKVTIMQIMHRSHFPELCKSEEDIEFGLGVYMPVFNLSHEQIKKLEEILIEESENFDEERKPLAYYVVDIGVRMRYGGYLLSRIINEVFKSKNKSLDFRLFSEGKLPYLDCKIPQLKVLRKKE